MGSAGPQLPDSSPAFDRSRECRAPTARKNAKKNMSENMPEDMPVKMSEDLPDRQSGRRYARLSVR